MPAVRAIHSDLIEVYGGSAGIRDEGLLNSTVASVAASLSFGLIKNHAFIDGNKRVRLAVLVDFLDLNGHELTVPVSEAEDTVRRAAASELSEAEWTAWVERSVGPVLG